MGITEDGKPKSGQAASAVMSAFEGAKLRFFGHLLAGLKSPSLVASIRQDLAEGRSAVVQVVSTNEAVMERRLAEIPAEEWNNLAVDLTPKDQVLDYLMGAFPIMAMDAVEDEDGNVTMVPVDGRRRARWSARRPCGCARSWSPISPACRPCPACWTRSWRRSGPSRWPRSPAAPPGDPARRPPRRRAAQRLGRQGRDRRLHGRQEAGAGVLRRRRHGAQLPRRPRRREPAAPGPLPGRARLARRRGHPGPGPLAPDQPGRARRCSGR